MAFTAPTIAEFKAQFARDFKYGPTTDCVMDADIQLGINMAVAFANEGLFSTQGNFTLNINFLAAHYMVMNLRAAGAKQGLSGQFTWMQNSKGVDGVSEGLSIPDRILANPEYAMLSKTYYGAMFLFNMLPQLSGNFFTVCGRTNP